MTGSVTKNPESARIASKNLGIPRGAGLPALPATTSSVLTAPSELPPAPEPGNDEPAKEAE